MSSAFREFSEAYRQFREHFPNHPLNEEVRNLLSRRTFPSDEWLSSRTRRMKDLMLPLWLRRELGRPPEREVQSDAGAA